jgi:type IV secretion system protein VirB10
MPVTEIGDPRLQALFGANDPRDGGVRPAVALPRRGLPPLAIGAIAVVLGVVLFMVLNERRLTQAEPSVRLRPDSQASAWQAPPPLYVPPVPGPVTEPAPQLEQRPAAQPLSVPTPAPAQRQVPVQTVYMPQPAPQMAPAVPMPQPRSSAGGPLVMDLSSSLPPSSSSRSGASPFAPSGEAATRVRASAFANRSTTIAQGTLVQAVLETAFNSTQAGFARAVVSRDVRSFDETKVLIPRGSKLIGEYRSEVAQGQKRAVIIWTRLIRPDGMTIAMDSPAVDTVGRGGVPASVNTHFLARLGDALVQSTFAIGSALAQQRLTGPVVVLSGNTAAAAGQLSGPTNYVPTLTVPAGKSISVFVAHDLDFSAAEEPR